MTVGLILAAGAVALGGLVQGLIGFGMALVAVPIVALADPSLVPVPMLVCAVAHATLSFARERADVDWRGVGWAILGRVPGTAIGVVLVDRLAGGAFSVVVGVAVLGSVLLSLATWQPEPTPRALLVAGLVSGAFGTAMSIGGPPVAMLYQRRQGPQVRSTLGAYFVAGALVSLVALAVGGQLTLHALAVGVGLLPFLVAGFAASSPLRAALDVRGLRTPVLLLSAISAVVLIGRGVASA
jgi:uncharacterized membrane protein YfcA